MRTYMFLLATLCVMATSCKKSGSSPSSPVVTNGAFTIDKTFNYPASNGGASCAALQADGKIVIGGFNGVQRVNTDGSIDPSFTAPNLVKIGTTYINTIAIQSDGKIVVGGQGLLQAGTCLIRLNTNGTLDNSFVPTPIQNALSSSGSERDVRIVYIQPDGKLLVGGEFSCQVGNVTEAHLVRLNNDGSADPSFNPQLSYTDYGVYDIKPTDDGKYLIAGGMQIFIGSEVRSNLIKIDDTGAVDLSVNFKEPIFGPLATFFPSWINKVVVQPDKKILIGGNFITLGQSPNSISYNRIARLNADGSLDLPFKSPTLGIEDVNDMAVLDNGNILVGRNASISFSQSPDYITVLKSTGDASDVTLGFDSGGISQIIKLSATQLMLVGAFTKNLTTYGLIRLNNK